MSAPLGNVRQIDAMTVVNSYRHMEGRHNMDLLAAAFWRVDQTCAAIAALVTAPDTHVCELESMAQTAEVAMGAYEAAMRPYMEEAVDFYRFRTQTRECCSWDHPYDALARAYNTLHACYWDAQGEIMNLALHLTGDDCVW
jgi:hypothetical protein